MEVGRRIEARIRDAFAPRHLEVANESARHNVPPASETHFRLRIVSECFEGRTRVQRHQAVYRVLAAEIAGPVHALGLETLTPSEWRERGGPGPDSPPCLGGDGTRT